MEKVIIDFENCYGISKLEKEFDFSKKNIFAIYAPNGVMKTSFAKTFQDISAAQDSKDRIFKDRETKRVVKDENSSDITRNQVFVIEPYNQGYKSAKISTLLVNKTLKDEYDKIYLTINDKKEILLSGLKKTSGLKSGIEETISSAITHDSKEFFLSLSRVKTEVIEGKQSVFGEVPYQKIFNDKIVTLLETADFKEKLSKYMSIYDQLISASTFFKKGVFNHNNAADITKNLKDNGFFKADHSIYINGGEGKREIKTEAELEKVIQYEKDSILQDKELAKSFDEIDKQLVKNKETKDFREYLEKNKLILAELDNLPRFKQKLWVAYLISNIEAYKELMEVYTEGKEKIEEIVELARKESTKWKSVIQIFNERFSVPFVVTMENQDDVILKSEAPNIRFKFKNSRNKTLVNVEESELLGVLSNGEKRALYILNIIFEVEARKEANQETLFIIDDIADSFDYKNKYAIIEYLNDISKEVNFYQIILTHNFDFYRTVSGRLGISRENRLHTTKSDTSIKLVEETYQNNPFSNWKKNLHTNDEMLIASIPFIRNLAEYCGFDENFKKLTSLLHLKTETDSITVGDLEKIIKEVLVDKNSLSLKDHNRKIRELIFSLSDKIFLETEEVVELEKKIVLSIAIRLKTEEFLITKINDYSFVNAIKKNQTIELVEKYKEKFPIEMDNYKLIEQVNLMTPENIHINSFMYEPILDMSNEHLKQLYKNVSSLLVDEIEKINKFYSSSLSHL